MPCSEGNERYLRVTVLPKWSLTEGGGGKGCRRGEQYFPIHGCGRAGGQEMTKGKYCYHTCLTPILPCQPPYPPSPSAHLHTPTLYHPAWRTHPASVLPKCDEHVIHSLNTSSQPLLIMTHGQICSCSSGVSWLMLLVK